MATKILSLLVFAIALILLGLILQWVDSASVTRYVEACPSFGTCPTSVDYGAFSISAFAYLRILAYIGNVGTFIMWLGLVMGSLAMVYSVGLVLLSYDREDNSSTLDPKQGY